MIKLFTILFLICNLHMMRREISKMIQYHICYFDFVKNFRLSKGNLSEYLGCFHIPTYYCGYRTISFCPEDKPKAIHGGQRAMIQSRSELTSWQTFVAQFTHVFVMTLTPLKINVKRTPPVSDDNKNLEVYGYNKFVFEISNRAYFILFSQF